LKKKIGKTVSGTCRYYVGTRYKCDEKLPIVEENWSSLPAFVGPRFDFIFNQKVDKKSMQKPMSKNMTFNQKATPKGC
jgi:hypothetical protein